MLNLWVVGLLVIVLLRDSLGTAVGGGGGGGAPAASELHGWVWAAGLAPYVLIALLVQAVMVTVGRTVDRTGSVRSLRVAEKTLLASRAITLLAHTGNVFVLGWLIQARALVGDAVLLDELICVLPGLLVIVAGWWSVYPVERRVREAAIIRRLDDGKPVHPVPSRWRYVGQSVRHQLSLSLLPIMLISAWSEAGERLVGWLADSGRIGWLSHWLDEPLNVGLARAGVQLAGVACVLLMAPLIVRVVWETTPLSVGPLRSRLIAMCKRHGVRVREILVWHTGGTMINGAVVGMFGRLRYVLLTDALLEAMPRPQVEAVMAHEVAHARCAHMPWLAAVLISSVGCAAAVGSIAGYEALEAMERSGLVDLTVEVVRVRANPGPDRPGRSDRYVEIERPVSPSGTFAIVGVQSAVTVGALLTGLLAFGLVSRRFEWQADAFAAKALSLQPERGGVLRLDDQPLPELPSEATPGESAVVEASIAEPAALTPPPEDVPLEPIVHRAAVDAMAGALQSVAALNYIPRHRRSFRHGSIAQRQQKLRMLVGLPLHDLPIDRSVRWIKRAALLGVVVVIGLTVWDTLR